jgi:hypothetical protein
MGIDLSKQQIEENRKQSDKPKWVSGDSDEMLDYLGDEQFDFVFTCPPYYDLEVYSDNPLDISTMEDNKFDEKYFSILGKAAKKLKNNRFFAIVVSEVREQSLTGNYKIGKYRGLVSKTIQACEEAGLDFYNDMVLFNSQHQAGRVVDTYFNRNRKVASVHQNVLVFVKGNPDLATEDIEWDGTYQCVVDGKQYKSFREVAISLNPNELVASEVERRCLSHKIKYKDWQIIGKETKPILKYSIDGYLFESAVHIAKYVGLDESEIRNRISSNSQIYSHWIKLATPVTDVSYDENENSLKDCDIRCEIPIIECNGIQFYSLKEAADYFGLSSERIRQKIVSPKYPTFFYISNNE